MIGRRALLVGVLAACSRAFDGTSTPYGYLTPKDVEAVMGVQGVRLDKDPSGSYVFVDPSTSRRLVAVRIGTDDDFKHWRDIPGAKRAVVDGLGKEAYQGPMEGREPTVIAVTKGDRAIEIAGPADLSGLSTPYDQLYRLAAIAAGRM